MDVKEAKYIESHKRNPGYITKRRIGFKKLWECVIHNRQVSDFFYYAKINGVRGLYRPSHLESSLQALRNLKLSSKLNDDVAAFAAL